MTTALPDPAPLPGRSPFAGADICRQAGLTLPAGARRPMFDDDLWDFTDVSGLPVSMALADRRFSFTPITEPAMAAGRQGTDLRDAGAPARGGRAAAAGIPHPGAPLYRLQPPGGDLPVPELARQPGRLPASARSAPITARPTSLHRRYVLDEHGTVVGERSPGTRRRAAQVIIDLLNYGELFTADRPDPGLRPWGGATASAIAEMPSGRTMNKTPPLSDDILRPMLAAALYLASVIGPHAVILNQQVREADQQWGRSAPASSPGRRARPSPRSPGCWTRYQHDGEPAAHAPRPPGSANGSPQGGSPATPCSRSG